MNDSLTTFGESLSVDAALRVDEACERFEAAWRAGQPPHVEDFLTAVERERQALLRELLRLDLHYRRGRGENPGAGFYVACCPADEQAVRALIAEIAASPSPHQTPPDGSGQTARPGPAAEIVTSPGPTGSPVTAAPPEVPVQSYPAVPGYELLGELGRGGMGVVYRARQTGLNRLVALKMILSSEGAGSEELTRFRREAEAVARLRHPNIVQVHAVGQHDGRPFCALELVDGGTLAARLRDALPEPKEAAALLETLARAMHAVHQCDVVHRDLKPANVLLTADGTAKITDFGLAKRLDEAAGNTHTGQVIGTPSYMAPEQAAGRAKEVGPAADVYALGAVLYECLTGRPPFRAATVAQTLRQVTEEEPVPPRGLNRAVPSDLETICLRCLHKEPRQRYPDANALADDLRRFQAREPIHARSVSTAERAWKWMRRRPVVTALGAAVVLVTLFGSAGTLSQYLQALDQADKKSKALNDVEAESHAKGLALDAARTAVTAEAAAKEDAKEKGALALRELHRARCNLMGRHFLEVANHYRQDAVRTAGILDDSNAFPLDLRDFTWGLYSRWCRRERLSILLDGSQRLLADGRTLVARRTDAAPNAPPISRSLLYDLNTGQGLVPPWEGAGEEPRTTVLVQPVVAATSDGGILAWAGEDNTIWTRARGPGRKAKLAAPPRHPIDDLTLSPDGKWLAAWGSVPDDPPNPGVASQSSRLTLWRTSGGKEPASVDLPGQSPIVAFSPDGRRLAIAVHKSTGPTEGFGTLLLWHAEAGGAPAKLGGERGWDCALEFGGDGNTLAEVDRAGVLTVWDTTSGKEARAVRTGAAGVVSWAVSPGAKVVALATPEETTCWDLTGGTRLFVIKERPETLALSPDGGILARTRWDGGLELRAAGDGHVIDTLDDTARHGPIAFTPDGNHLIKLTQGGNWDAVKVWEVFPDERGHTLAGHRHVVTSVAFSPDGSALASGSLDHSVKLWDSPSGQERATLAGHADGVTGVCFGDDGRVLATASRDGTVRVWDAKTGRERAVLRGHDGAVRAVAFAAAGPLLASGGKDGTVRLWDSVGGKEPTVLRGHKGEVLAVAFRPDGKLLASAGEDGTARLWDPATGEELRVLTGHAGAVCAAAFSPDGTVLVTGSGGRDGGEQWFGEAVFWEADTGLRRLAVRGHTGFVRSIAFTPDGKTLATADDRGVIFRDPLTGQQRAAIRGDGRPPFPEGWEVWGVAFNKPGSTLAVAGGRPDDDGRWLGEVRLWVTDPQRASLRPHAGGISAAVVPASGEAILTLGGSGAFHRGARSGGASEEADEIKVWDRLTGTARATYPIPPSSRAALGDDGKTLAFAESSVEEVPVPEADRQPPGAGITSLTRRVRIKLREVPTGEDRGTLPCPGAFEVAFLAFGPGARTLAAVVGERSIRADNRHPRWEVRLWDVDTGQPLSTLPIVRATATVCVGPEGKTFAVPAGDGGADDENGADLWEVGTGKQLARYRGAKGFVSCLAFSPDGTALAGGGGSVELWDVKARTSRRLAAAEGGVVRTLAFAPDGKTLAGASADRVTVWDVATGEEIVTFYGAAPLAFTPDGKTLIAGGEAKVVRLWDLSSRPVRRRP